MASAKPHGIRFPLEPVLYAIHSSASLDALRAAVSRFARELMPSNGHAWYQFNPGTFEPCVIRARGVTQRFLGLYEKEGRARDLLFRRLADKLVTVCSDIDLNSRERHSFKFQERISSGHVVHAVQAPLVVGGELVGTLNFSRNATAYPFTRTDAESVAVIARHTSIALERAQRESEIERRRMLLEMAIDVLSLPFAVFDSRGEMIFANRSAGEILDRCGTALASTLRTTAARLLSDGGPRVVTDFVPRDASGVRRSGPRQNSMAAGGLTIRSARIDRFGAIVSFFDERRASAAGALDALSPRERQITELVARGLNNAQIAAAASISRNTVKQHLKHVFEKMRVMSRAELAAGFTRALAETGTVFAAEKSDS